MPVGLTAELGNRHFRGLSFRLRRIEVERQPEQMRALLNSFFIGLHARGIDHFVGL